MPKFERDNSGTVKGVKQEKFYRMFLGRDYNNCDGIKIEATSKEVTIDVYKNNQLVCSNIYPIQDCNIIDWVN